MTWCPYSEDKLQEWDSICNPMGKACYECNECECEHWAGDHSRGCPQGNPDCFGGFFDDDMTPWSDHEGYDEDGEY